MLLAAEEIPFVLQGPKPPIPPGAWENYWVLLILGAGAVLLVAYSILLIARRRAPAEAAIRKLERALAVAEPAGPTAVSQISLALRVYLAAVDPQALPSLSTEELERLIALRPVFLPARQPLLAALRAADAAKFAGGSIDPALLLAGVREAARRVEDARQTFSPV